MKPAPIQLYLINGFLGSGKTTLLRSLIDVFHHRRLGVLVNEFGSIGIDGTLVGNSGIKLVEINDGSIFCACLKDGFVRTLKAFSQQPIDVLLIESSGMADPAGMTAILDGLAPYLERSYQNMGSVCLVDCTTFADYADVLLPVQNQVASADLVVLNKIDLVDENQLAETNKLVRLLNKEAPVFSTIYAHVPPEVLESRLKNRGFTGKGANTPYNRPATCSLLTDAMLTEGQAQTFCAMLAGKILRFKGFLRNSQGGFWHVEGVASQHSMERAVFSAALPPASGRVVMITFSHANMAEPIKRAWQACSTEPMELKTL